MTSVIIVSWNSARFLRDCLDSVLAQDVPLEVIVVDNGSSDGSAEMVAAKWPQVQLLALGENRGFCAANNAGMARARGEFLLFLNSDTILESSFLREALRPFAGDERIGSVGGKLLRFDRATIDSAGQFLTRSRRTIERGYNAPDGAWSAREGYVFGICGAALLCRRRMVEDITVQGEFFDESFFAFSEDLDLAWRARLAGWRAWYAPRAVAYHYRGGSESSGGASGWMPALVRRPRILRFHILKNRWLTIAKNDSYRSVIRDLPFIVLRDAAMLAAAAIASPAILVDLLRIAPFYRQARRKRKSFLASSGTWGARRAGAPSRWVRWTSALPRDPDSHPDSPQAR